MLSEQTISRLEKKYKGVIGNIIEIESDLMRFVFVYRLVSKFERHRETNVRLLINHMIVLFNAFEELVEPTFKEYIGDNPYVGSLLVLMQHEPDTYPHDKEFLDYIYKNVVN